MFTSVLMSRFELQKGLLSNIMHIFNHPLWWWIIFAQAALELLEMRRKRVCVFTSWPGEVSP